MNKSTKFNSICIAIILLTGLSVPASARDLTGVTVEWAPHYGSELDQGGALTVITKEAFRRTGHSAELNYIAWNRALKNVEEGKNDFVMGAYINPEREKTYIMSEPIYYLDFGLVALDTLGFARMNGLRQPRALYHWHQSGLCQHRRI